MTALSSFRCREVGLRKYKDFAVMITLLSLICSASSLISKKAMQKIKENIQTLREDAAIRKLSNKMDMVLLSLFLEETMDILNIESEILNWLSSYGYPAEELQDMRRFLAARQGFMTKKFQNEAKQVNQYEDTLTYIETFVANLAEKHVDL